MEIFKEFCRLKKQEIYEFFTSALEGFWQMFAALVVIGIIVTILGSIIGYVAVYFANTSIILAFWDVVRIGFISLFFTSIVVGCLTMVCDWVFRQPYLWFRRNWRQATKNVNERNRSSKGSSRVNGKGTK